MFTQLLLFDKTVYKAEKVIRNKAKLVVDNIISVTNYVQTKIKILANQFIMCIPDTEDGLDTLINPQYEKKKESMFSRDSIKDFMQNIFNARPKVVFY